MKRERIIILFALLLNVLGVRAQNSTHWYCNSYDYEHDMAVYFVMQHDNEIVTNYADYEVAAFVGKECRGIAEFQTLTLPDKTVIQFGYLRIRSNQVEGETISFKAYQTSTDKVLCSRETMTFKELYLQGLPSNPHIINFLSYIPEEEEEVVELDETSSIAPTESESNVKVCVKRSINANEWSTICLPFDMTAEQIKTAFGNHVKLGDFDGCKTSFDATGNVVGIKVKFNNTEVIKANHPYIIKVETTITTFDVEDVKITPETTLSVDKDEKDGKYNSFVGTYQAKTVVPSNCLFLNGGNFWYSKGKNKMKAFRGYFNFYDVLSSVENESARITLVYDSVTSGMTEIAKTENGTNVKIYNLLGQPINKPRKGAYIKDGKKFFIK